MKYFISYSHEDGFGNCTVERVTPLTLNDITELGRDIERAGKVKQVVVIYFHRWRS